MNFHVSILKKNISLKMLEKLTHPYTRCSHCIAAMQDARYPVTIASASKALLKSDRW